MRHLVAPLIALAIGYAAVCAIAFAAQRKLLYPAPPPREPRASGATLLRPGPFVALHAPSAGRTAVHFHGNGEQLADAAWLIDRLRAAGLGVLSVEYPGYGPASAEPISEAAIYAAAEAALRTLPRQQIVLLGISLGSGVAVEMARRGYGTRMALVAPYLSIPDVAAHHYPWLPARLLVLDRFDSARKAPSLKIPTLIVHGTRDEIIPFEQGRKLASRLPGARFVPVEGASHNDVLSGPVLDEVAAFLLR